MIYVENKKRKIERVCKEHPNALILDITSKSSVKEYRMLSPFYPHMNIPIPYTEGLTATCVEAIWQGLKVFDGADVDFSTFKNNTMCDLKRTVRKYGPPRGHRKGAYGEELLNYFDARMLIYLPTYKWVLDNVPEVHMVIEWIKEQSKNQDIVLLDYNTNIDIRDVSKPLSHAGLVKLYIEGNYPTNLDDSSPLQYEDKTQKKLKTKKKSRTKTKNRQLLIEFPEI